MKTFSGYFQDTKHNGFLTGERFYFHGITEEELIDKIMDYRAHYRRMHAQVFADFIPIGESGGTVIHGQVRNVSLTELREDIAALIVKHERKSK